MSIKPSEYRQKISSKIPCKANINTRWIERITSVNVPSMNFTFDVTFPNYKALRFELIPKYLPYAEDSHDCLECFMIKSVIPFYTHILYPGDILLKINGHKCISTKRNFNDSNDSSNSNNEKSYLRYLKYIGNLTSSSKTDSQLITLRFLRSGGNTLNFMLTPSEVTLFQSDKHVVAKFIVTEKHHNQAASNSETYNNKDYTEKISQESKHSLYESNNKIVNLIVSDDKHRILKAVSKDKSNLDSHEKELFNELDAIYLTGKEQQLPYSVLQMIQGKTPINWSAVYNFPSSLPAAFSLASSTNILNSLASHSSSGGMINTPTLDVPTLITADASLYQPLITNLAVISEKNAVSTYRETMIFGSSVAFDMMNMNNGIGITTEPTANTGDDGIDGTVTTAKRKYLLSEQSDITMLSNSDRKISGVYRDYSSSSSSGVGGASYISCSNHPYIVGKYDTENAAIYATQQLLANNERIKSSFDVRYSTQIPSTVNCAARIDPFITIAPIIIGKPPDHNTEAR